MRLSSFTRLFFRRECGEGLGRGRMRLSSFTGVLFEGNGEGLGSFTGGAGGRDGG